MDDLAIYFAKTPLVPAVIQDAATGDVLMLGYMDEEALQRTLRDGKTWFWSRSRQNYWLKGETSGNYQYVQAIYADCDRDAFLIRVHPQGPSCHTGARSCFFEKIK